MGSWVSRQLFEQGHRVVIYERRIDTSLIPDIVDKVDVVVGDISDLATIIRTLKEYEIERIIHMAALMPGQCQANPSMGFQTNACGTLNVLEAARITGVERVVFTSAKAVYAPFIGEYGYPTYKPVAEEYEKNPVDSLLVYGTAKIASEFMGLNYAKNYGLDFTALRFAGTYGPGKQARHGALSVYSKLIENAMIGLPTTISHGGDEKNDMIYVKDVASAIILVCFKEKLKHHVFNIGTGRGVTLRDLGAVIKEIYPDAICEIGPGLDYMDTGPVYGVLDCSRARNELNFAPKFTLETGVKDYIETALTYSK